MSSIDILTAKQISENLGYSGTLEETCEIFSKDINSSPCHGLFRINEDRQRVDALAYAIQQSAKFDFDREWIKSQSLLEHDISVFALEEFITKHDIYGISSRSYQTTLVNKILQAKLKKILSIAVG